MKNITKYIIIIFSITAIIISFNSKWNSLIKDFESNATTKEALINKYIECSSGFIDVMAMQGNYYLKYGQGKDSEFYSMLKYNSDLKRYSLDALAGTKYEKVVGNLTGLGSIPQSGIDRTEINLALQYSNFFGSMFTRLPDITWLYYTSENNFINMYPFVSSKDFSFKPEIKNMEFYKSVNPKNDPERRSLWTPVYNDVAGKGLMVTLSSPIYYNDIFKGAVSLDLTNAQLSMIIKSEYESYLIDSADSIIATSSSITFGKEVIKLNVFMNSTQNYVEKMKALKSNTVERVGKNYIYSVGFSKTPWRMFFILPVCLILFKCALYTLPILIICILLLIATYEVERRIKTESLLKNSFEELKSYQEILENAATFDFLTKTYNRRGFKDSFNKKIVLNSSLKIPVVFLLGDIDYFKHFNDTFGHFAGDRVLIEISNLMKNNIGADDVVCRWGGEEFLIMLFNRTFDEAVLIAENIRREVEAIVIPWEDSLELRATMTFGVAEYSYEQSIEDTISKADIALYEGKIKGRNQVVSYSPKI